MSKSTPNDSSQGFLSSANIKQASSFEHLRKSSRLAEKKAEKEVGDSLVLTEPSTYQVGTRKNEHLTSRLH